MKNLLVIAYSFPPSSVIGTQRTLAFVKYLRQHGWRSSVLCAEDPVYPERDENLVAQIPADTTVVRTRDRDLLSVLQPIYRRMARRSEPVSPSDPVVDRSPGPWQTLLRSVALRLRPPGRCPGWYRSTLQEGRHILQQGRMDAIYSSGPPWSGHLVGLKLATEFDLPWVADFRDQWVSDPFDDPPTPTALLRKDLIDEARVVQRADLILCVVETMRRVLHERYPERSAGDIVTILNGFDPENLEASRRDGTGPPADRLRFVHTGHFYGKRRVEPFLAAYRKWREGDATIAAKSELELIGGSGTYLEELRARVLASGSIESIHVEAEIPYQVSLRRQAEATVLLLVGFTGHGEETQMSGKIFEYLSVRRPILALAPAISPLGEVLRQSGVRHWIVQPNDEGAILKALRQIGEAWSRGELDGPQSSESLAAFDRREQTKQLVQVLNLAIARRTASLSR